MDLNPLSGGLEWTWVQEGEEGAQSLPELRSAAAILVEGRAFCLENMDTGALPPCIFGKLTMNCVLKTPGSSLQPAARQRGFVPVEGRRTRSPTYNEAVLLFSLGDCLRCHCSLMPG